MKLENVPYANERTTVLWRSPEDEIEFSFNPAVSGMGRLCDAPR
jgi:hypothetical protein